MINVEDLTSFVEKVSVGEPLPFEHARLIRCPTLDESRLVEVVSHRLSSTMNTQIWLHKIISTPNSVDLLGNYPVLVHPMNNASQNMGHDSSSSTYVKSGTEKERGSFCCSDLFEFEIPDSLDIAHSFDL
ncbi:hypothetical protein Fmac_021712 [Flemingia macrophylla]|uniref:Uncharacterized protein n=1 Tax=Flemingia macrophylla TaxID=520843 RepID=A0ABD1LXN8_9FABA